MRFGKPEVRPTKVRKGRWCRGQSSFGAAACLARAFTPHVVDPGLDSRFASGKRAQKATIFLERILGRPGWTDDGAVAVHDKIHAVAGGEAEAVADFLRDRDLSLAADGAGVLHLY